MAGHCRIWLPSSKITPIGTAPSKQDHASPAINHTPEIEQTCSSRPTRPSSTHHSPSTATHSASHATSPIWSPKKMEQDLPSSATAIKTSTSSMLIRKKEEPAEHATKYTPPSDQTTSANQSPTEKADGCWISVLQKQKMGDHAHPVATKNDPTTGRPK